MKQRYFIYFAYNGSRYCGWQIQPNGISVQEVMMKSFYTILRSEIEITAAGRTDAGVHASFFCAHFDSSFSDLDNKRNFVFKLNRFLPDDISVKEIRKVKPDANARFSAVSRTYKYLISRTKDPFTYDSSWFIHGPLDIENMNKVSALLLNYSDFTSFSRLHSGNKTNICRVYHAFWTNEENNLIFTIRADRFLRNMVRALTGTIVNVGKGKINTGEFEMIIQARDRGRAAMSAPAKGLFLTDIEYPQEIFI